MSDSPLPPLYDDEDEPVTGILDVPRGMRPWAESQSRKVRRVASAIDKLDRKLSSFLTKHETERGIFKSLPTWLAVLALLASGLAWYAHATAAAPPPLNAQDLAREIFKLQQQQH